MGKYCPYSFLTVTIIAISITACASTDNRPGHYSPITNSGVTFEFNRCKKVARDIHCSFFMTTDGRDTLLEIAGSSKLSDNLGKKYLARHNKIANKALELNDQLANRTKILAKTRTESLLKFYNFSEKATHINKLEIVFTVLSPIQSGKQTVVFTNILI